jgi:rubrerythrin
VIALVVTKKDAVRHRHGSRIRCPKCAWEPGRPDRWMCEPGCGHVWNTFETHGVCPACNKQWAETNCLRCHQWSPHEDWYVKEDGE